VCVFFPYLWSFLCVVAVAVVVPLRVLVGHNWLELLVRILHVVQAEIQAVHKGLVVEAAVGGEHVKGIAVLQRAEAE